MCKDFKTHGPNLPITPVHLNPLSQGGMNGPAVIDSIMIRVKSAPDDVDGMLRRAVAKVDPNLPVTDSRSMDSQISGTLTEPKLTASLAVYFGLLALTLDAVGLCGFTAYTVAQRTDGIGIRMTLGSTRFGIFPLVLGGVPVYIGLGLLLGISCALSAGYLIRDPLYELHWYDPISLLASVLILSACALAAGLVPACRAASIHPKQALGVE